MSLAVCCPLPVLLEKGGPEASRVFMHASLENCLYACIISTFFDL